MSKKCKHTPVAHIERIVSSSYIGQGVLAFDFFNYTSWFCYNCKKPLKATWSIDRDREVDETQNK